MTDKPIIDPAEVERYVQSARDLYGTDTAMEIANPPVVVKTASGARVMAWLPVEDEDLTK
jgi:hypothetical protein